MKCLIFVLFFALLLTLTSCQTCKPPLKEESLDIILAKSPIVVEVSPNQSNEVLRAKKGDLLNISAEVVDVFPKRNGGLKIGDEIKFGPVGKVNGCTNLKVDGSSYLLFLQEAHEAGFHWIKYNPIKATKKTLRKVRKLLCKKCMIPASFKTNSKTYKKEVGRKLKIRCKASGKPAATISWYHNDVLLTKATTPKEFKIKNRKKGKSGTLEIKNLTTGYNNDRIICSAVNIASEQPANYTVLLKVSEVHSATCPTDLQCSTKYPDLVNYCYHGTCCLEADGSARCICFNKWTGSRCQDRSLGPLQRGNISEDSRHQQRLVAILGMCLALMVVLFICFAVYCLFKRKRSVMHRKHQANGYGVSDASSPMLKLQEESDDRVNSRDFFNAAAAVNHVEIDGGPGNRNSGLHSFGGHDTVIPGQNSDVSSFTTPVGERRSFNHPKLAQKVSTASDNGNNNKRKRLNGSAKSGFTRSSVRRGENGSQKNSPAGLRKQNGDPVDIDMSPLTHHESHTAPSLPLDSGLQSIVKHQSNNPSLSHSKEELHCQSTSNMHSPPLRVQIPASPQNKNHTVTTFSPDGDIQQESLGRDEGTLSSVTPHSPPPLAGNVHNHHFPLSPKSPDFDHGSVSKRHISESNSNQDNNRNRVYENVNTSEFAMLTRDPELRTSDQEDPFKGVEIPDTSLGLYTPQHSLEKPKLTRQQRAIDSDGFYYPDPYPNAPIASAQLNKLHMLSRQVSSPAEDDMYDSTASVSAVSDGSSSIDDSRSHKIIV